MELVNVIEQRISAAQASAHTASNSGATNYENTDDVFHFGAITLHRSRSRSSTEHRSWTRANFVSGLQVEVFNTTFWHKRTISCFIAVIGESGFHCMRVDSIDIIEGRPFAMMHILPVCDLPRDPLFSLAGVSAESDQRGCRYVHVRKLACDPFGDLDHCALVRTPLQDIVECCAINNTHIALLPHAQLSFSS